MTEDREDQERGEAARVQTYRANLLEADGQVGPTTRIAAEDDIQASEDACRIAGGRRVELWQGLRFVDEFGPEGTR